MITVLVIVSYNPKSFSILYDISSCEAVTSICCGCGEGVGSTGIDFFRPKKLLAAGAAGRAGNRLFNEQRADVWMLVFRYRWRLCRVSGWFQNSSVSMDSSRRTSSYVSSESSSPILCGWAFLSDGHMSRESFSRGELAYLQILTYSACPSRVSRLSWILKVLATLAMIVWEGCLWLPLAVPVGILLRRFVAQDHAHSDILPTLDSSVAYQWCLLLTWLSSWGSQIANHRLGNPGAFQMCTQGVDINYWKPWVSDLPLLDSKPENGSGLSNGNQRSIVTAYSISNKTLDRAFSGYRWGPTRQTSSKMIWARMLVESTNTNTMPTVPFIYGSSTSGDSGRTIGTYRFLAFYGSARTSWQSIPVTSWQAREVHR